MENYCKHIDETIIKKTLPFGLNCIIIPKELYGEKRAAISINYGSVDSVFLCENTEFTSPKGTAHFLEHKLFDNDESSAFDSFAKLGSYVNAYTSFNSTAYYFSCFDNYGESLRTLLDFVLNPYFTEDTVQKEMGIIEQEINMYEDNPGWAVYFLMLSCLYKNHTAKDSIAGSAESVKEITKDILYKCYQNFYVPENMYLICAGDIDREETLEICGNAFRNSGRRAETVIGYESENVNANQAAAKMKISKPLFQIGFKNTDFDNQVLNSVKYKVMLDLLIGESSSLREDLIQEGLSGDEIGFDYISGGSYGYASISGRSREPFKFLEKCRSRADKISQNGFLEADFNRIKGKYLGRFIRGFNSVEAIITGAAELAQYGADLSDAYEMYEKLDINHVNELVKDCFKEDKYCMAVIQPE